MCFIVSASHSVVACQGITMDSVQFLAAKQTANATPPMAIAVAPNSHFQLRSWGKERDKDGDNVC